MTAGQMISIVLNSENKALLNELSENLILYFSLLSLSLYNCIILIMHSSMIYIYDRFHNNLQQCTFQSLKTKCTFIKDIVDFTQCFWGPRLKMRINF